MSNPIDKNNKDIVKTVEQVDNKVDIKNLKYINITFPLDEETHKMYNILFQKTKHENKNKRDEEIHQMIFMDMFYKLIIDK